MRKNIPRVSILMAVYNGEDFLQESIDSLLAQTLSDFELVIIDDASTDSTPLLLSIYARNDHRVSIIRNSNNLKLPTSLNIGLQHCRAILIARADADDVYLPHRLEKQVEFMDAHPEVGVLGAACSEIDRNGNIRGFSQFPEQDNLIRLEMPFITRISHPCVMFRKDLILSVGGYNEKFWTGQDFELWSRLIDLTRFANILEPLWFYRQHSGTISATRGESNILPITPVSRQLLSKYLGRELTNKEAEAVLLMYRSWAVMPQEQLLAGVAILKEYLYSVIEKEDAEARKYFKRLIAKSSLRQSVYQTKLSKLTSIKLLIFSVFLSPRVVMSKSGGQQFLRIFFPLRMQNILGRLYRR